MNIKLCAICTRLTNCPYHSDTGEICEECAEGIKEEFCFDNM